MPFPDRQYQRWDRDPLWYKSGVIYKVHLRALFGGDADGTGALRGLTEKLDYIEGLGATAIWLLPFSAPHAKGDGEDTADDGGAPPSCGAGPDFETFLREAHRRGLRVITELVLHDTPAPTPAPERDRSWRDFYVWGKSAMKNPGAPGIFEEANQG